MMFLSNCLDCESAEMRCAVCFLAEANRKMRPDEEEGTHRSMSTRWMGASHIRRLSYSREGA